jgi:hypothetical protein
MKFRREAEIQESGARKRAARAGSVSVAFLLASSFWLVASHAAPASAAPSQDDVLRSIGQNIDQQKGDPSKLLALLAAAGGFAFLLVVLGYRRKRELTSTALHHHGKLLREICRAISLKPTELRQLRQLADERGLASPLTLLLCPSLHRGRGRGDGDEATGSDLGVATAPRD